jgi:O2-independent ubiquinone biosynthesis accessory factor UbiT
MKSSDRLSPLSPVLFADLALRPLPPVLLRPFLDIAMAVMQDRHPDVFARLEDLDGVTVIIDPVDLPLRFQLCLDTPASGLRAIGPNDDAGEPAATIRGPLAVLIDLLEGRLDGDAAFFSRDLAFEGNTEVVVTLRNAIDSGEIDLKEDFLSVLGLLQTPARFALDTANALMKRAASDLGSLRMAVLGPPIQRTETDD